jgi:hypothetical protein
VEEHSVLGGSGSGHIAATVRKVLARKKGVSKFTLTLWEALSDEHQLQTLRSLDR